MLFFLTLAGCGTKPGILAIVDTYSDRPSPLQQLHDQKYLSYSYIELLDACEKVEVTIIEEMAALVEMETRDQSNSKLRFMYRAGRITASRMKSVCHADSSNPSQSLVKTIVYPDAYFKRVVSMRGRHEITMKNK